MIDELKSLGLDTVSALKFCTGDEEFYTEILEDFTGPDYNKDEIDETLNAGDMDNYETMVHALKSTAKTIGATGLSEMALKLETAAKSGDMDYINNNHALVMNEYEALVESIKKLF